MSCWRTPPSAWTCERCTCAGSDGRTCRRGSPRLGIWVKKTKVLNYWKSYYAVSVFWVITYNYTNTIHGIHKKTHFNAIIWHCSSGDGSLWSSGISVAKVSLPNRLTAWMPCDASSVTSAASVDGPLIADSASEWLALVMAVVFCDEVAKKPPTRATQSGVTVISPIASVDVHRRRSSRAAGC